MASSQVFVDGALEGRVALVTGGGTNLGKAAAAELARCGASVVIAGRREEVLEEASQELGDPCSWVAGDIRERDGAHAIVHATLDRHKRLDFLLNNAGGQYFVPAENITAKGWRAVQRLNVGGPWRCARRHTSSRCAPPAVGRSSTSRCHPTTASRRWRIPERLVLLSKRSPGSSRQVWAVDGVSVARVALGRFATESLRKYPVELWRRAAATVPLQRLGELEEYGWLVALLASRLGASFSGSVVTIDGALDNWSGRWPPEDLVRDGEVPTEERPIT